MEKKKRQKECLAMPCVNEERSLSDEAQKSATRDKMSRVALDEKRNISIKK